MRNAKAFALSYLILMALAFLVLYPFVFMLFTSLKDNDQFYHQILLPTAPVHWDNYAVAFEAIWRFAANSVVVTAVSTIGVLAVATLAGYSFARLDYPGRDTLFLAVLALLMIPAILTLVTQFVLVKNLGLVNSLWGLILPYIAGGEVFSIFILKTFFSTLPQELFDASYVDGATEFDTFRLVAVPLVRPAVAAVAVVQILAAWNDYVWPSIVLTDQHQQTLMLGLLVFQSRYQTQTGYGPLMAGYTLASLPLFLLFIVGMKQFMEGLTTGALKV
jgi:raffinose/stachyose/melibiose transport system permease protein